MWERPGEAPKWSEDDGIIVKRSSNPKESTVEAWGLVDGQPTSRHFDLIIYDDVVTRESVTTPDMIQKTTDAWELSLNLLSENGRKRYIGTRYHFIEADEVLSALRFETKLEKATLARVAFALSLAKEGRAVIPSVSFTGGEMKRPTFIGEDEVFIRTLISHAYQKREISEDEFFSNRSLVKNHIDSGAAMLGQLFQECGRDADKLLENLLNEVEFGGRRETAGHGLDIFVGRTLLQRTELIVELNNTARHANCS